MTTRKSSGKATGGMTRRGAFRRDAQAVAGDCGSFQTPSGPQGRFTPYPPYFWGVWSFSKNKTAAKEITEALLQRDNAEARGSVVSGYDAPPFTSMLDFKVWEEVERPEGTVYNYPMRPFHNAKAHIAGLPASPGWPSRSTTRARCRLWWRNSRAANRSMRSSPGPRTKLEGFTR